MPRVFPDISLEMKFKELIDLSLYLPFDGDADDASGNGLTPSTESGAIIYPSWVTPVVGSSAVQLAEATTNLVTNPSFETNTTGWATVGANTIAQSAEQAYIGTNSLKCTYQDDRRLPSYAITLTAAAHTLSIGLYIPSGYDGTQLSARFEAFGGATGTASVNADMTKTDQWQVVVVPNYVIDAGDLAGIIRVRDAGFPTAGRFIYIDGVQCEAKAYPTPYCDGSLGEGHSWSGAAHASTSSRTVTNLQYTEDCPNKFTIGTWFSPLMLPSETTGFTKLWEWYGDGQNFFSLGYDHNNNRLYAFSRVDNDGISINHTDIARNTFIHAVVTFDETTISLYIDKELIGTDTTAETIAVVPSTLYVGRGQSANRDLNGWLDEFLVLDYALTAAEVAILHNNGLDGIAADGIWTDRWADVIAQNKVKATYGIKGFLPTQRAATSGKMTFQLNNSENNSQSKLGLYSPGNANAQSGFEIGMPVRLKFEYNEIRYYKFYGTLREIKPLPGQYRKRVTSVTAVDFMADMSEHKLDLLEVSVNSTSNQLVSAIIGNMTRQPNSSDIEVGQSIFAYAADGLKDEKTTALAGLQRTVLSEFGYAYTIGDSAGGGKFRYEDRHERVTNTTIEATLTEDEIATLDPVRTDKNIFNRVEAKTFPRDVGSSNEILYSSPNPVSIGPGNIETIIARYRDPNQESARISGTTMVTPVKDTDYKFGSSEGGGSNDMNDDLGVDVTFGANSAKIVLTNNAVSSGFLNLMQLRGLAIRLFDSATALALDSTSKLAYGDRPLNMSLLYQDSALEGQDFADVTLSLWKDPRNLVKSVGFWANQDATRLVDALEIEPGDRVSLSESLSAIDDEFFVNGVELVIHPTKTIFCKWFPAPASDASFWLLGEVGFSEIGETTTLGF